MRHLKTKYGRADITIMSITTLQRQSIDRLYIFPMLPLTKFTYCMHTFSWINNDE